MSIEQSFFIEIRFKNALEVRELIMTFVLLIHVKSIKNTLINWIWEENGVGMAFTRVSTDKRTDYEF